MKLASIDIGTNSTLLLITETSADGGLTTLEEQCSTTRLGAGVANGGLLSEEAVAHTLETLEAYARRLQHHGVDWRGAVGTAALRDVANGASFLASAEQVLSCPVEVVSGEREAALMVAGIEGAFGRLPGRTLMVDIGGGSTELVLAADGEVEMIQSLPLGSVRLSERHFTAAPPESDALVAARAEISSILSATPGDVMKVDRLIGTAGTVTTLATVQLQLETYDSHKVNGLVLDLAEIQRHRRMYQRLPLEKLQRIPGLDPARADVILAGTLILEDLMGRCNNRLRVCDRGIRWGVVHEALNSQIPPHLQ